MVILNQISHEIPSDCLTCQTIIPGISSFGVNPEETTKGSIKISCILEI